MSDKTVQFNQVGVGAHRVTIATGRIIFIEQETDYVIIGTDGKAFIVGEAYEDVLKKIGWA